MLCALLCFEAAGCRLKSSEGFKVPPEEASRKNPLEPGPATIAEGKRTYDATDCAICHGKDGDGRGVLVKDVKLNLRDWRDPGALANFTDGELYYIIEKGKGRMPGYGKHQTQEQVWGMVSYIRSYATRQPSPRP